MNPVSNFIGSASNINKLPQDNIAEVCFLGRSNVGKSSLINFFLKRKKLAYVANRPGKTQLLNLYSINNNQVRFVDCPGYGYARLGQTQQAAFKKMMEAYLTKRANLKLAVVLTDMRRPPTKDDHAIVKFLQFYQIKYLVIGTKQDKLKKNNIKKAINNAQSLCNAKAVFIATSSQAKIGFEAFWDYLAMVKLI